jgi:hypothetical protein
MVPDKKGITFGAMTLTHLFALALVSPSEAFD